MKVGVIGRGRVAQALETALSDKHEVRLGTRVPSEPNQGTLSDVAGWAEVVILATPWSAEAEIAAEITNHVEGKVVIDAANPVGLRDGAMDLVRDPNRSDSLSERLPGADVVKGFNQIGAEFIANPGLLRRPPLMFFSSESDAAKSVAMTLGTDAGFHALDGGPMANARHLESLAMLWIWSAAKGPLGRTFGFALARTDT